MRGEEHFKLLVSYTHGNSFRYGYRCIPPTVSLRGTKCRGNLHEEQTNHRLPSVRRSCRRYATEESFYHHSLFDNPSVTLSRATFLYTRKAHGYSVFIGACNGLRPRNDNTRCRSLKVLFVGEASILLMAKT